MLIEFTVGNFRSFKSPVTFSMVAANISSSDKALDVNNTYVVDKGLILLKSAALYGANASGKTNVARALIFMKRFVRNSSKAMQDEDPIGVEPFRLSTETEGEPSFFEIVFLKDGKRYRYGFEVTRKMVVSEWLFSSRTAKETQLFVRDADGIKYHERAFKEGRQLEDKTRSNALYLSVVAQFNGEIAKTILHWFRSINIISGLRDKKYLDFTLTCVETDRNKEDIYKLIHALDLSINSFKVERLSAELIEGSASESTEIEDGSSGEAEVEIVPVAVKTTHTKFDAHGEPVGEEFLDLGLHESEGTKKLFAFAGPLVDTLKNGMILFIDEMDARLHPLITCAIIKLFQSPETNPKGAQLLFSTHDSNLLSNRLFRRDQIWFAEKDRQGATHLYSLVEYKLENGLGVRNDATFENDYIKGRYGAVPFIGDLTKLIGVTNGISEA